MWRIYESDGIGSEAWQYNTTQQERGRHITMQNIGLTHSSHGLCYGNVGISPSMMQNNYTNKYLNLIWAFYHWDMRASHYCYQCMYKYVIFVNMFAYTLESNFWCKCN